MLKFLIFFNRYKSITAVGGNEVSTNICKNSKGYVHVKKRHNVKNNIPYKVGKCVSETPI